MVAGIAAVLHFGYAEIMSMDYDELEIWMREAEELAKALNGGG